MLFKRECNKIEALLWGYAAARLSEAETAKVERHLNACPSCREQVNAYGQTVQGVAMLRVRPVPVSQASWQDVQRRLETALPVPAHLSPLPAFRRAAAGLTLVGVACLLVGITLLWQQSATVTQETGLKSLTTKHNHADRFKIYRQLPKRLTAAVPDANLYGNKDSQGEDTEAQTRFLAAEGTPAPIKNLLALKRAGRREHYLGAARQRRRKHLHSAYLLAQHKEPGNALPVPSVQIVSLSVNASPLGPEREQPQYVLTTIMDSAPQPRDFVMDSMTIGAQNSGSNSYNTASNGNGKEIRGW